MLEDIARSRDKGMNVDILILDISKAFNTVPHAHLLKKWKLYGIKGSILGWIEALLTDHQRQVVLDGVRSESVRVWSGVPQSTVLVPLMFLLYINDIGKNINHSHICLFDDDCLLYREISCDKEIQIEDDIKLQRDLTSLQDWSQTWQMQFNVQKCYTLSVTKRGQQLDKKYSLNGHTLKSLDHYPYPGVEFQSDLKWSHHITNVINKASRSLGGIVSRTFGQCPAEMRASGYYTLVRPHLEYALAAWDPHYIKDVKKLEGI